MWSARRPPNRVSGPAPRTTDIDTDERRQTIPQRGRPTTNCPPGVDKRCLIRTGPPWCSSAPMTLTRRASGAAKRELPRPSGVRSGPLGVACSWSAGVDVIEFTQ